MKKEEKRKVVSWECLYESNNRSLDKLFEIYRESKFDARVIFKQAKGNYDKMRIVLFEYDNGDFNISSIRKRFGVSKTNKMYSHETANERLIWKAKTNKFYLQQNHGRGLKAGSLMDLTYVNLSNMGLYNRETRDFINKYIQDRFGWYRNILENRRCQFTSFNVIIRHKLYNNSAILRHIYDSPKNVLVELFKSKHQYKEEPRLWKGFKDNLTNIDSITVKFLGSKYLMDSVKMAGVLGRKINCKWGDKRLKVEHDKWAREIRDIKIKHEELIELDVSQIYIDFAEFSGFRLLKTNHDLSLEGFAQDNCVSGYSNSVNSGHSGIYHIDGNTLELGAIGSALWMKPEEREKNVIDNLKISQVSNFNNSITPKDMVDNINSIIESFKEEKIKAGITYNTSSKSNTVKGGESIEFPVTVELKLDSKEIKGKVYKRVLNEDVHWTMLGETMRVEVTVDMPEEVEDLWDELPY